MAKATRQRIPKLRFTSNRGIGWHVAYRDRITGLPRRHRFAIPEREREKEARILYHAWVTDYLGGNDTTGAPRKANSTPKESSNAIVLSGSLLEIASGLIESDRIRVRTDDGPRRRGTIHPRVFMDRKKQIHDFLEFLSVSGRAKPARSGRVQNRPL